MVTVTAIVGVDVTISVKLSRFEVGMVEVMLRSGAVDIVVEVAVRFDRVTVCVVQVVEVPIDRYELQKGAAEDASRTATTSLTAEQSMPGIAADGESDDPELVVEVDEETMVLLDEDDNLVLDEVDLRLLVYDIP